MKWTLPVALIFSVTQACYAGSCSIYAKTDLDGRASPSTSAKRVPNVYKKGDCIKVNCQATGDQIYGSRIWDFDGKYYLPDYYVKTGFDGFDPHLKRCAPPSSGGGGGCHGHLNTKGLALLKELEGWRANFYYDLPNGKDKSPLKAKTSKLTFLSFLRHKTIGYGHNCDADATRCKNLHPPLSKAQGEVLLKKDVSGFEKYICQTVTHQLKCPLNCNQFGALVSFAYNTGTSANGFRLSKVYEQLKAGCNYKGAANVWTSSFTTQGLLTNRRKKEVALFTTPTSSVSGC